MHTFPQIEKEYLSFLIQKDVPEAQFGFYLKWLRYYLDFCAKYGYDSQNAQSLPYFLNKLTEKDQSDFQQQQARQAVQYYYVMSVSR
jgi:hypothetical protein